MAFIWHCKVYYETADCELCCTFVKEHIITTAIVFSGHKNSFLIIEARLFKVITYSVALLGVALFNLALFDAVMFDIELF